VPSSQLLWEILVKIALSLELGFLKVFLSGIFSRRQVISVMYTSFGGKSVQLLLLEASPRRSDIIQNSSK
jgi:hypothetical protein